MKKRIYRRIALLISLIMLITSSVQTTYGFIIVKTDTLINTFVPGASVASFLNVTGTKNLHNRNWQDGDAFDFRLEMWDVTGTNQQTGNPEYGWVEVDTETVAYDPAAPDAPKTFDFSSAFQSVDIYNPGVYSFRISEVEGTIDRITYDDTEYTIDVTTALDAASGKLVITGVTAGGGAVVVQDQTTGMYNISVSFDNYFGDVTSAYIDVNVDKTVNNTNGGSMGPGGFVFELFRKAIVQQSASTNAPATDVNTPAAGGDDDSAVGGDTPAVGGGDQVAGGGDDPAAGGEGPAGGGEGTAAGNDPAAGGEGPAGPVTPSVPPVTSGDGEGGGGGNAGEGPTAGNDPAVGNDPAAGGEGPAGPVTPSVPPVTSGDGEGGEGGNAGEGPASGGDDPAAGGSEPQVIILAPLADEGEGGGGGEPQIPADNTQQTPGDNTQQTPGDNTQQTPGDNTQQTPGDNTQQAPGDNTQQTPGDNTQQTPGDNTQQDGNAPASPAGSGSNVVVPEKSVSGYTDDNGDLQFKLEFTSADVGRTYEYVLSEVAGSADGVAYDTRTYEFTVTVSRVQGRVTAVATDLPSSCAFVNVYSGSGTPGPGPGPGPQPPQPPAPEEPDIPIEVIPIMVDKSVISTGDTKVDAEGFEFILEDVATGKKELKKTAANGKAFFYKYFFTEDAGKTFNYKLYEVGSGAENMYYDSTVYDIRMDVTLKYGEPVAAVYINDTLVESYVKIAKFTNIETSGIADISLALDVDKTVENTGDKKASPKGFKFILEDVTVYAEDLAAEAEKTAAEKAEAEKTEVEKAESEAVAAEEATNEGQVTDAKSEEDRRIVTKKSDKKGKASFDLTYTSADIGKTFSYKLYEQTGSREGMTYDTTVYDIQVTVGLEKLIDSYELALTVTCNGVVLEEPTEWTAEFTNIYHVEKSEVPKTGDGSNLPFWFNMMLISALACLVLLGAEVRDRRRG